MQKSPARFGGGPDRATLEAWIEAGYTDEEMGVLAGSMYGTDPARKQTVLYWRRKHNLDAARPRATVYTHGENIPWKINTRHLNDPIYHRLYLHSRRSQGAELSAAENRRVDEFVDTLKRRNVVVDYDARSANGWMFRPRDPQLDDAKSLIRRPAPAAPAPDLRVVSG